MCSRPRRRKASPMPERSNKKADRNCSVDSGSENWHSSLYGLQTPVNQKRRKRSTSPFFNAVRFTSTSMDYPPGGLSFFPIIFTVFNVFQQLFVERRHIFGAAREGDTVTCHGVLLRPEMEMPQNWPTFIKISSIYISL